MELTMEAVELAPMIAPEQLGAQRERPPPAWLIVLPPSRLRAFRYLELSRTPPASLSLPSAQRTWRPCARDASTERGVGLRTVLSPTYSRQGALLAFAQLIPWHAGRTLLDSSPTGHLLVPPEMSMLHSVSVQPPWYAPRALPMGIHAHPSAALAMLTLTAEGEMMAAHALRPRAPVHLASTASLPPHQVLLLTDPR
jgi:hypothetical protein